MNEEKPNPLGVGMTIETVYGRIAPTRFFEIDGLSRRDETPEQKAERKAKYDRLLAAEAEWTAQVDAITEQPFRALLDLHSRENGYCQGCDWGGYEGDVPEWPCRTVDLIAEMHGLTKPRWDSA